MDGPSDEGLKVERVSSELTWKRGVCCWCLTPHCTAGGTWTTARPTSPPSSGGKTVSCLIERIESVERTLAAHLELEAWIEPV